MSRLFLNCLAVTLKHEGGISDNPSDPGGLTNKGITLMTLSNYLSRPATREDLLKISSEDVQNIYKKFYWDKLSLDKVPTEKAVLAFILFDQGVNTGVSRVQKRLSLLLKESDYEKALAVAISLPLPESLIPFYIESQKHYTSIVKSNASLGIFLGGWLNRINTYLTYFVNDDTLRKGC